MPSAAEWAWAAGLWEGEGSIVLDGRRYRMQLKMTDEDVVLRFRSVVGGRVYGPYSYDQGDGSIRKPAWVWMSDGADPARILDRFWPWLGERRRARVTRSGVLEQGRLPV